MTTHINGGITSDDFQEALVLPTRDGNHIQFTVANIGEEPTVGMVGEENPFGVEGVVQQSFQTDDSANQILIQDDDYVVTVGQSTSGVTQGLLLARYDPDGNLDTANFGGGDGWTFFTIPGATGAVLRSVGIQSTGAIIVCGYAQFSGQFKGWVLRFTSAGVLDSTFGSSGMYTLQLSAPDRTLILSSIILSDDTIILAGQQLNDTLVAKLLADGSALDIAFNATGYQIIAYTGNSNAQDIVEDASHNLYVLSGANDFGVSKLTGIGALVGGFGTSGKVEYTYSDAYTSGIHKIHLQSDGKILVSGYRYSYPTSDDAEPISHRFTTAGVFDTTWGSSGDAIFRATALAGFTYAYVNDSALNSDDELIVVGAAYTTDYEESDNWIGRWTASGTIDLTFFASGFSVEPISGLFDEYRGVTVRDDDWIFAAGYVDDAASPPSDQALIVAYPPDGSAGTTTGMTGGDPYIQYQIEGAAGRNTSAYFADFSEATTLSSGTTLVGAGAGFVRIDDADLRHYRCSVKSATAGEVGTYRVIGHVGDAPELLGG